VHLAEYTARLADNARLAHFEVEVITLARALAHTREHGETTVLGGDVANELLNEHGLAHARAAEQPNFAALRVGGQKVDDLDAGLELLDAGCLVFQLGCGAVNRQALVGLRQRALAV